MTPEESSLIKWDKSVSSTRQRLNIHYSKVPDILNPIVHKQLMDATYHKPGAATRHYSFIYNVVKLSIPVSYDYYYSSYSH